MCTDSALRPTGHSFENTINVARAREGFENGGGATSRRSSLHSSLISPPRSLVGSSATEVNVSFMIISRVELTAILWQETSSGSQEERKTPNLRISKVLTWSYSCKTRKY